MALLKNGLSLFNKLFMGYLIFSVIMIVPCVVSIYSLSDLERFATSVAKHDLELSKTIEQLKAIPPSMEAEGRRLVTLYKEDAYQSLMSLIQDFKNSLISVQRDGPKEIIPIVHDIELNLDKLEKLAGIANASLPRSSPPEITPIEAQRENKVKAIISSIMTGLHDLEKGVQQAISLKFSAISSRSLSAIKTTIIVLVGAIVCVIVFTPLFLYQYIKKPIDHLRQGTEIVGEGHFDQPITIKSRDELGKLAEAFNNMAKRLKELDKLKSDFIGIASHELKTPLTSMMEASELLSESKIGRLNEEQQNLVTILNRNMSRFHGLIDDLLHLSRLKARLQTIKKRSLNITKVFSDIIQTLGPMAQGKNLDIELISVSGLKKNIPVDEGGLFGAFINIVHNAIKFSPENEKIKIILDHADNNGNKWLRIGIIDAGPGVEKSETEKIFDKFYQIQHIRINDGAGLGLAIAREIILAHGGKMWVESPPLENVAVLPGKGAAFWSILPYSS
ncbi:MAG: HAMP domain-containing sensor histidine kinase [Thermodesulfobacteriota bacterium]|nr:HAMP domain-containing sensor histidine kinase [Thermodesulfobacteriota bacterium]